MMSFRIAYYKVHYPAEFYAVYLTTKIADFNWEVISCGKQAVINRMEAITIKGNNATAKENDELTVLEIVYEMFARGYEFMQISVEDAKEIDPAYEVGDVVEYQVKPEDFGRIAAQTAKQVVVQRIREAERGMKAR